MGATRLPEVVPKIAYIMEYPNIESVAPILPSGFAEMKDRHLRKLLDVCK